MSSGNKLAAYSRRLFLKAGGALLAGGVLGSTAVKASQGPQPPIDAAPPLPWKWRSIDPMDAGSRAYRFYLDTGG